MSKERTCSCPASVYGGFKQGTGIALGFTLVAGVPFLLLLVFALPAYLGSLARAAGTPAVGTQQGGRVLEMR